MSKVVPFQQRDDATTLGLSERNDHLTAKGLSLRIISDSVFASYPLPSPGSVVVGRSQQCDIRIDDASISRRHAALHVDGDTISLEDLGSANGTRLRDRLLDANEPAPLAVAEVFEIGSVLAVVQLLRGPESNDDPILAKYGTMSPIYRLVDKVAAGTISVLLLGETGSGKEVMAETIHKKSARSANPFLRLNCAALSESLLESELFGHEKGAFTGALSRKPGLLETANGGTVFLDEIGELPLRLQAKLLRALEERQVLPVGALKPIALDVRFLAATNCDLQADIRNGTFREDLFFRLNGISILIPPLRDRLDELQGLARGFITKACRENKRATEPSLSDEVVNLLKRHTFPGNIRELRNVIERAVLLCEGDIITPEHLPPELLAGSQPKRPSLPAPSVPQPAADSPSKREALLGELAEMERQRLLDALARCGGNQTHAAKLLGISRGTLLARLEAFGLPRPRKGRGRTP